MDHRAVIALANAAQAVHTAARSHKHAEQAHRRQAQRLMRHLDEIVRECARMGVHLEITETPKGESE